MNINPLLMTDFYKVVHRQSYVDGLDYLTSYWTPRKTRVDGVNAVVNFGLQGIIKELLIENFKKNFFERPLSELFGEYTRAILYTMGDDNFVVHNGLNAIKELHDLGYLPIEIKALPEGVLVPIGVPMFEITNTVKGFGWLVNYLETYISSNIWLPITSATTAYRYRDLVNKYYYFTSTNEQNRKFALGDFSMRGMTSFDSAIHSSAAHLTSFVPTATIPSILWTEKYYNADITRELVGTGTASMEHSVMSSYTEEKEFEAYQHLINNVFPKGKLSIVSDTYNYWRVLKEYLPKLKEDILKRDGTILIRGDSGDPDDIICGAKKITKEITEDEIKGTVELLWEIFGGTVNSKGYKVLDPHVRAIYGDSITPELTEEIYKRLMAKGFAVDNIVLGIGSYTYQYVTRDTYGFALKATHAVVNGEEREIYKDPITDKSKFKKSQKGKVIVQEDYIDGKLRYIDQLTTQEQAEEVNLLETIFKNSEMVKETSLSEIRKKLHRGDF